MQAIARRGEGGKLRERPLRRAFPELDVIVDDLRQRDLIEETRGGYRIQVEMIRRWFAQGR